MSAQFWAHLKKLQGDVDELKVTIAKLAAAEGKTAIQAPPKPAPKPEPEPEPEVGVMAALRRRGRPKSAQPSK